MNFTLAGESSGVSFFFFNAKHRIIKIRSIIFYLLMEKASALWVQLSVKANVMSPQETVGAFT